MNLHGQSQIWDDWPGRSRGIVFWISLISSEYGPNTNHDGATIVQMACIDTPNMYHTQITLRLSSMAKFLTLPDARPKWKKDS